jgi:hypothetical protein
MCNTEEDFVEGGSRLKRIIAKYILFRIWDSHSSGYEEFCLQGYKVMWSAVGQSLFWRNLSPPLSECKNKSSKKPPWSRKKSRALVAVCHMFPRNVSWHSVAYAVSFAEWVLLLNFQTSYMYMCREVIPSIATTILRVLYCLHVNQYNMFRPTWAIFR